MLASLLQAHADQSFKNGFVSREMLAASPVINRRPLDQARLALLPELADQLVRTQPRSLQEPTEHLGKIC